ncbi:MULTISPECIES: hypothetical protein [Sulfurospirillum]|uniref:hypothetical protein n=1 Tax=Sulfurospirillum TaxID=57665 RepID=UPI0007648B18|nr:MULTISPECIES: hypothetical protein [Sulfurospirillum]MCP3651822.1 hypothetical protein [Sulfurospirillum sp. DNRA8]MCR1810669.1 hypothetical protein [Sulfurospirillum sp. DNRA8]
MKKIVLTLALLSQVALFAGFLDDLIGKDKAFLEANGFKCTEFSCVTKDQNYFNIKLLDNAVEYVEVYSNEKDEVYKVAFYLYQNDKLKNKELDDAFFKALQKINEKSKWTYELNKISDKFGNEALITMTDTKRANAFVAAMRDTYMESMKQFSDKK